MRRMQPEQHRRSRLREGRCERLNIFYFIYGSNKPTLTQQLSNMSSVRFSSAAQIEQALELLLCWIAWLCCLHNLVCTCYTCTSASFSLFLTFSNFSMVASTLGLGMCCWNQEHACRRYSCLDACIVNNTAGTWRWWSLTALWNHLMCKSYQDSKFPIYYMYRPCFELVQSNFLACRFNSILWSEGESETDPWWLVKREFQAVLPQCLSSGWIAIMDLHELAPENAMMSPRRL